MSDFLNELATKAGLDLDQVKKGLGALLSMVRNQLPKEEAAQVEQAIPGSEEALSAFSTEAGEAGGLLGKVTELAGKLIGKTGEEVSAHFGKAGLSLEQIQKFLPALLEILRAKLPPELFEKIKELIPGQGAAKG